MKYGADNLFGKLKSVLLAKPLYLDVGIIALETPWQKANIGNIDKNLAIKQHEKMVDMLKNENVECFFLKPIKGDTEQKDCRDVGLISSKGAIVATQRHMDIKKDEDLVFIEFCDKHKIPVLNRNQKIRFEGGDFFFVDKNSALIGLGPRTKLKDTETIKELLNKNDFQMVPHKVSHHLDGAFNIISKNLVVVDERYLNKKDFPYLEGKNIISVVKEDPMTMPTNFLLLEENKILTDIGSHNFNKILEKEGVDVIEIDVSELKKNGGSVRCMTLPIYRE